MLKGFEILKSADVFEGLLKYREQGALRGKYLGFERLDQHYTMALGTCTDWTGYPRSGKTQVLMECLLNTSKFYGWKHLVYFPDVGDDNEIIADLLHKLTGKTFDKKYQNFISEDEISKNLDWILEHFKILTKKDIKAKITPYEFWDLAIKVQAENGLQTASIDSWKDMKHETMKFGRDDKYLEDVLSYRNAVAEKHKMHLHTVVHPKLTDKDKSGKRKPPTPYDIKGGSEWFNNGKCMITVHRESMNDTLADVYVNKIKPRSVGSIGNICLNFDVSKLVYYEIDDANQRNYAMPKTEKKPLPKQTLKMAFGEVEDKQDDYDDLPF